PPGRPYVYTNFIASLDGRIARTDPEGRWGVPPELANGRDWRLYMELAMQADVVLTSGRLLRAVAAGRHTALLDFNDPRCDDLRAWRRERGLSERPVVAAVTRGAGPAAARVQERYQVPVLLLGPDNPDEPIPAEVASERLPGGGLDAGEWLDRLTGRGLPIVYSVGGPTVFTALLQARAVDRLYLTTVTRLLGGTEFKTLLEGQPLAPPTQLALGELYLDPEGPGGAQQLFAVYDCLHEDGAHASLGPAAGPAPAAGG
ncbi:MAG TPA: dihydrofolate reductase family protein, partial [Gammaproteobacteria bacterium]|nr:dihydrofolate reductase family protein [Gammaproteobacteria bacterium]